MFTMKLRIKHPTEVSQRQRDNLLEAKRMWSTVPERNILPGLYSWRAGADEDKAKAPTCKTIACFGGWCAWWPEFQAQGIIAGRDGAPLIKAEMIQENFDYFENPSLYLFGIQDMFSARPCRGGEHSKISDWQFVDSRIDLSLLNVIVS